MKKSIAIFLIAPIVIYLFCSGGCAGGGGGSNSDTSSNTIQNTVLENVTPIGLSTFALGVPKFPLEDVQTPEGVGYKSVARVVRHIATNELFTFPETPDHLQIETVIKSFIDAGHLVTHEIHILNGPSMRKSRDPWTNNLFGGPTSDQEFVNGLQSSQGVRDAVQNLFAEAVAHAQALEALGAEVIICPELEDNETHETFQILLNLLSNVGWNEPTKIVRNAGYPGEFGSVRHESHGMEDLGQLRPGDILNNDGNTFCFNSNPDCAPGALTENDVRYAVQTTQARGIIYFLWSAHLQGNQQVSPGNFIPYPEYTNRNYVLEKPIEQAAILLSISPNEIILKQ